MKFFIWLSFLMLWIYKGKLKYSVAITVSVVFNGKTDSNDFEVQNKKRLKLMLISLKQLKVKLQIRRA